MKPLFLFLIVLASCSSADQKQVLKTNLQEVISNYLTNELEKYQEENTEKIVIDSVIPIKVDSISDLDLLNLKYHYVNQEFERKEEILQIKVDKMKLQEELGIYENARDMAEIELKDLKEGQKELETILSKLNVYERKINAKPDSTNFLYYGVTSKVYATENETTERTMDVYHVITKSLKIKESKDLVEQN